ncbi:MAG TPA: hypothetical protein VJN67_23280 [Stellaceae bacterium]|nr:hypothetical protein [Stellaceae bacterium]
MAAQLAQAAQQTPPAIPADVVQAITAAAGNAQQLEAAVTKAVTDHPDLAADIAALAVSQNPQDAAGIAAAASKAAPTQIAAIIVAVVLALPPGTEQTEAPVILAAIEQAVPEAGEQITAAITQLALNQGPNNGINNRSNLGAPLVANHTDVPSSPTR